MLLSLAGVWSAMSVADEPVEIGYGPSPTLPKPEKTTIPTVHIAPARSWREGEMPTVAAGFKVNAFAADLDHPRWLYVLPNGDVLVAETNAPERPEEGKGIKGMAMKQAMKNAGSAVPSANRITLLRDSDGDGVAETRERVSGAAEFAFRNDTGRRESVRRQYRRLMRFPYREGATRIAEAGSKVADLPAGPRNHHWTKNVIASPDGSKLYVTAGSNSNVAEHGMQEEEQRAAILEIDAANGQSRVFASGLRNPNGLAWQPQSRALWTTVNERDELGDNLVPDYMTSVREGGFYGWPYSYYGQHVDDRVKPQREDLVASAIVPDYALGSHTAALGLAFYSSQLFPSRYQGGAFVGQHGSWNRKPRSGYKVIFVPFADGKPNGQPEDILTGFINDEGDARGRPVGVVVDKSGALLVADDVGNRIWRVTPVKAASP